MQSFADFQENTQNELNILNLDIMQLSQLSDEAKINLYRQGFELPQNIQTMPSIKTLGTCASAIQQNTSKNITLLPSSGTPPYTLEFLVDGTTVKSFPGVTSAQTFSYTFSESLGNHSYQARVTDSCITGAKQYTDSCTISITSTPPPISGCTNCNTTTETCIMNTCVSKNILIYGGAGFVALLLLSR